MVTRANIPNFPGYMVDVNGVVWSAKERSHDKGKRGASYFIGSNYCELKSVSDGRGYLVVNLRRGGKTHIRRVHRLVIEAFKGKSTEKVVRHLNDIGTDNCLENLAYGSYSDNMQESKIAKLNKEKAQLIRLLYGYFGWTQAKIANMFLLDQSTISDVTNRKSWSNV